MINNNSFFSFLGHFINVIYLYMLRPINFFSVLRFFTHVTNMQITTDNMNYFPLLRVTRILVINFGRVLYDERWLLGFLFVQLGLEFFRDSKLKNSDTLTSGGFRIWIRLGEGSYWAKLIFFFAKTNILVS